MASSELSPQLTWKNKVPSRTEIRNNTKLYWNKFPHVVTIGKPVNWKDGKEQATWRGTLYDLKKRLDNKLTCEYSIRIEWSTMRVFTHDIDAVIAALPSKIITYNLDKIEVMRDDVRMSLQEKPDTYKSVYSVVKKLPWDQYRYKIHYVTDAKHKRMIGKDALEAIAAQISMTPGVKWTQKHQHNCSSLSHNWNANYFYSQDLEWLPMVMLINPRFIRKIEFIKLESEIE